MSAKVGRVRGLLILNLRQKLMQGKSMKKSRGQILVTNMFGFPLLHWRERKDKDKRELDRAALLEW